MMKLIRVSYGKKDLAEDLREYRIDGKGPVGCLHEFKTMFPDETFEIIDPISGQNFKCSICNKSISKEEYNKFDGMCARCENQYYDAQIDSQMEAD